MICGHGNHAINRFLTFLETCEPEALFSEEELDKLLREGQSATPSTDNEVGCYGN